MFEFHLDPPRISLPIVGGVTISVTLLNALIASAILIALAAIVRVFLLRRFTDEPRGVQTVVELMVDGIQRYTDSRVGAQAGASLAPYIFTLGAFVVCSGLLEFVGLRPNMSDINSTLTLSLITFALIQVYGIRKRGLWGRIRLLARPKPFLAPIMLITNLAAPVSLACRMFGNILGGFIVMELIYSVMVLKFGIPAFLSIYFSLFHTLMQAFIFITLSLTFIDEVLE